MKWMKFTIETTTQASEMVSYMLAELGIEGVEIQDNVPLSKKEEEEMYIDIPAKLPPDDGKAKIHFYVTPDSELLPYYSTGSSIRDAKKEAEKTYAFASVEELMERMEIQLEELRGFLDIGEGKVYWEYTEDKDWINNWKDFFHPFYVAENILVKPTWEEIPEDTKEDTIVLEIDPGTAFGTGSHETTRLCLLSLAKYINEDTTLLDAGCGSGILAIAALKLGAKYAFGMDIDIAAVQASEENAKRNHIPEEKIQTVKGNILENENTGEIKKKGPFSIAVANILADVIIPLSSVIGEYIQPGGLFISSGILEEKAEEVEKALIENGYTIQEKNVLGEWVSFVAQK